MKIYSEPLIHAISLRKGPVESFFNFIQSPLSALFVCPCIQRAYVRLKCFIAFKVPEAQSNRSQHTQWNSNEIEKTFNGTFAG